MSKSEAIDEHPVEQLKKKIGIDELISRVINKPVYQIEADLDPRLIVLVQEFMDSHASASA